MQTKLTTASGATGAECVCQPLKDQRIEAPKAYKPLMRKPRKIGHRDETARTAAGGTSSLKDLGGILAGIRFGLLLIACSGCAAWAPNSWNVTWYEGDSLHRGDNMLGVGFSGPIPPMPWNK